MNGHFLPKAAARTACYWVLSAAWFGAQGCDLTAPPNASIEVSVEGIPNDAGIILTAFVQDNVPPFNRSQSTVPVGGSTVFSNLGPNFEITAGIQGLNTHRCFVRDALIDDRIPITPPAFHRDSVLVSTASNARSRVNFKLVCASAMLRLNVTGLPPGDSATVVVSSNLLFVSLTFLRVGNGTTTVPAVPDSIDILPGPSSPSAYLSPKQEILVTSRQTTTVDVHFQPSSASPCTYLRPVAWYPFDGGGAADASTNGNNGTVLGATATSDRFGTGAAALSFDGIDDAVDLGDRFNTLQLPFTVAAWVFQPASARSDLRAIFVTDDEPGRYAGIWFQIEPNGMPQITFADGGTTTAAFRRTLSATTAIPADTWVHVAARVRGPDDMLLFINGAPVGGMYSGTGGPLVHTSAPARIGSMSFLPANRPWLGLLDDVRVYDCSLPASEIAQLFNHRG